MLELLHIENIAIIDRADITFEPGFNALTGETGAGKSIVIDSLSAVLGQRRDDKTAGNHFHSSRCTRRALWLWQTGMISTRQMFTRAGRAQAHQRGGNQHLHAAPSE